jgi:hypothetical protein
MFILFSLILALLSPAIDSGELQVVTNPAGAYVYLDGKAVGITPLNLPSIAAGQHRLVLYRSGFMPLEKTIVMVAGKTLRLQESILKAAAWQPPPGITGDTWKSFEQGKSSARMVRYASYSLLVLGALFLSETFVEPEPGSETTGEGKVISFTCIGAGALGAWYGNKMTPDPPTMNNSYDDLSSSLQDSELSSTPRPFEFRLFSFKW